MIYFTSLLGFSSSLSLFLLDYLKLIQNGYKIVCSIICFPLHHF